MNTTHMITTQILGLAAMSQPQGMPEPLVPPSPGPSVAAPAAWGSCEIRLMADRVASLRTGSTHKVYRGWRFEAAIPAGLGEPGTPLFTMAVDPAHLAASQSRYAVVQLANQGAVAVGGSAAFSWSASSIGTADPFAATLAQVRRQLADAGWTQDAAVSTHYTKPDPTPHVCGGTALPCADTAHAVTVPRDALRPGTSVPDHLPMATTAPSAVTGLDGWETDGGAGNAAIERSPSRRTDDHR